MSDKSIRSRMERNKISGQLLAVVASTPTSAVYVYDCYQWRAGRPVSADKAARLLTALENVEKLLLLYGSIPVDLTNHDWVKEAIDFLAVVRDRREAVPSAIRCGAVSAAAASDDAVATVLGVDEHQQEDEKNAYIS